MRISWFLALGCAFWCVAAPAQPAAFQIAGNFKTREKSDEEMKRPRGRDVDVDRKQQVLEIKLRRINPTVGDQVRVQWVVLYKDLGGRVKVATRGQVEVQAAVGAVVELTSDPFTIEEYHIDRKNGHDRKAEQEIEGYAIRILDPRGNELGVKFQPGSIEENVRAMFTSTEGGGDAVDHPGAKRPKVRRM